MKPIRTLVVEDDDGHARLIGERLRASSEIAIAASCETLAEAIEHTRALGPRELDVVLLDLGLPDSEGIDTVRSLRLAAPRLPIVVLSGQRDLAVAIEAMRHGAQDYVVKSAGDTESLVRALRLAIERKRLQDVEQMLVGVVSHDLRAPLQTIVLGCDMLLQASESRHIATIRRAALRATALVNDLLDATRARLAGVLPIDLHDLDVAGVVDQVIEDARLANPHRKIEAELIAHAPLRGDGRRISQIAQNLLANALQHSPASSPVRVTLRVATPDDFASHTAAQVELAIHNGGPAIPASLCEHMFEPLERTAVDDRSHSIGLGLYIVAEIVRAHGGSIQVESDAATGTTFRVLLPTAR